MAETTPETVLSAAAAGPLKASGDAGSIEGHKLSDLIAVADRAATIAANRRSTLPLRYAKIKPGGAI